MLGRAEHAERGIRADVEIARQVAAARAHTGASSLDRDHADLVDRLDVVQHLADQRAVRGHVDLEQHVGDRV
ncbi:MAG: hypothetical protein EP300_01165, partial [Gammaproteobacteria bacterium]